MITPTTIMIMILALNFESVPKTMLSGKDPPHSSFSTKLHVENNSSSSTILRIVFLSPNYFSISISYNMVKPQYLYY